MDKEAVAAKQSVTAYSAETRYPGFSVPQGTPIGKVIKSIRKDNEKVWLLNAYNKRGRCSGNVYFVYDEDVTIRPCR